MGKTYRKKQMSKLVIKVHHIGSRGGGGWLDNPLRLLGHDVFFTLYDADEKCVKDDKLQFKFNKPTNYKFIHAALSEKNERRMLNINREPNTSSLLGVNDDFNGFVVTPSGYNFDLMEACETKKRVPVECWSLDELVIRMGLEPPDYLGLDTQGTECDILRGADGLLGSNILGVWTEVEFVEFYKNQKKFDDIFKYLNSKGFVFVGLYNHYDTYPSNTIDHIRGKGFIFGGDGLFLKNHRHIIKSKLDENDKIIMLFKLATISICFNLLGNAYHILKDLNRLYADNIPKLLDRQHTPRYIQLCMEYFEQYEKLMHLKFPKQQYFASMVDHNQSKLSYSIKKSLKIRLKPFPRISSFLKKVQMLIKHILSDIKHILSNAYYWISPMDEIELILFKYALSKQAKFQKRCRASYLFK